MLEVGDKLQSEFPQEDVLLHRLRRACLDEDARPISLIVGAGASQRVIPGTDDMLEIFGKSLGPDREDLADFEKELANLEPSRRYQHAAKFIINRAGLNVLNRAVRLAVLKARTPPLPPNVVPGYLRDLARLEEIEKDTRGWALPAGIKAIGELFALIPPELRGPILTTNFDPLLEVSVRLAGLEPVTFVAADDGMIPAPRGSSTIVSIAHLHGFWRDGDTLHSIAQLASNRPKLLGNLRNLLTDSTCLVVGYGGWDDILTRSIMQLVDQGQQRELEVLWSCYRDQPEMGVLTGEAIPGRIQPYVGVDANTLLPGVVSAIRSRVVSRTSGRKPATGTDRRVVEGMTIIDSNFISIHRARNFAPSATVSFFDGREPSWGDIVAGRAPILTHAKSVIEVLASGSLNRAAMLLEGPTGEGKSTLLRQAAVSLGSKREFGVYWADTGRNPDLGSLAQSTISSTRIFAFIDDADLHIKAIADMLRQIDSQDRRDITLVLAARDTDWSRSVHGTGLSLLSQMIDRREVAGLELDDAAAIVSEWTTLGVAGLGKLADISGTKRRAEKLYRESLDQGTSSLLGAMLAVRYGDDFKQHVRELLERLGRVRLPNGDSLLDAYLLICLPQHLGLAPYTIATIAARFEMSDTEVLSLVVSRLGREAAAQRHGDRVVPRHQRIANVVVEICSEFDLTVEGSVSAVVGSVVKKSSGKLWGTDEISVIYSGQRIADRQSAVSAVDAATDADPLQLRLVCSQLGVYRKFGLLQNAGAIANSAWLSIEELTDVRIALRPFLREWARVEGMQGRWRASAALNAISLLNIPAVESLDEDGAARALSGLSLSLKKGNDLGQGSNFDPDLIGITASEVFALRGPEEMRAQAARTIEDLGLIVGTERGGERDKKSIRQALSKSVRFAINSSRIAPAGRYRSISSELGDLWDILKV